MRKLLSLISLLIVGSSQLHAGVMQFSKLSEKEQNVILEKNDNIRVQYNEITDEVTLDDNLEKELREKGILHSENASGHTVCIGGG